MNTREFLEAVVTTPNGYFCLAVRQPDSAWYERWYEWPGQIGEVLADVERLASDNDVYFSSYLFSAQNSAKNFALPSRTIQADLDNASIGTLPLTPTILVQTSPNRHQGYWVLSDQLPVEQHEILSRKMTYAIELCDHSGWAIGRKMRLPGSLNHKYLEGPDTVIIVGESQKKYSPAELELLPDVGFGEQEQLDLDWTPKPLETNAHLLLNEIREKLPPGVFASYDIRATDRSRALWALLTNLFRSGLDRDTVFHLAQSSANNKFASLRFGGDRELAKDVLRAEQVVKNKVQNPRTQVMEARKMTKAIPAVKKRLILNIVLDHMRQKGDFFKTSDEQAYYIRRDLGRPIAITKFSESLAALLELEFGLNATESEQTYTVAGLQSTVKNEPINAETANLSYYDLSSETFYLHLGRKDVLRITKQGIDRVVDGSYGIVFPWPLAGNEFTPNLNATQDWGELLFGRFVHNIVSLSADESMVLLKVWFLFLMFKSLAFSRPIITLIGQIGSGKSTLFRCVYAVLYGRFKSISEKISSENFDMATVTEPFHVLDNVDTWAPWLQDRLAAGTSTTDIIKRKLYSDVDPVIMRRQALIGITAHNPQFGREDVADRMLLFMFERLEKWTDEGDIIRETISRRNDIWGGVVKDIHRAIQTPFPPAESVPQLRVQDFARVGYWLAGVVDPENGQTHFTDAIKKLRGSQRSFSLDQEAILIDAMQAYVNAKANLNGRHPNADRWLSASELWAVFEMHSADPEVFKRQYKSAVTLGKKMWSLLDSLKTAFQIEAKFDETRHTRVWRIHG